MIRWRIYYEHGVVDDAIAVADVPGEGVIGIVQDDSAPGDMYATGRELLFDRDFYWWDAQRWEKGDLCGLFDYLRRPGWKKVLAGRTVPRALYKATLIRMQADPDFAPKSAYQAGEDAARET